MRKKSDSFQDKKRRLVCKQGDALMQIALHPKRFRFYLGAGLSVAVGVPSAQDIVKELTHELHRARVPQTDPPADRKAIDEWCSRTFSWWDDETLKYGMIVQEACPTEAAQVGYFEQKLAGVDPTYAHHVIAKLAHNSQKGQDCRIWPTIYTTNFDKLMERAFYQLPECDCSSIRSDEEVKFLRDPGKNQYVVKLHGDYNCYNIRNTPQQVSEMPQGLTEAFHADMRHAGLLILGTRLLEPSVRKLLLDLFGHKDAGILGFGTYVSVYVDPSDVKDEDQAVEWCIEHLDREINAEIVECAMDGLEDPSDRSHRHIRFFPVFGSDDWCFRLVQWLPDTQLKEYASQYDAIRQMVTFGQELTSAVVQDSGSQVSDSTLGDKGRLSGEELFKLGRASMQGSKVEEAVEYLEKAIDNGVQNERIYGLLGFAFLTMGRFGDALSAFQIGLRFGDTFILRMGEVLGYYGLRKLEDAASVLPLLRAQVDQASKIDSLLCSILELQIDTALSRLNNQKLEETQSMVLDDANPRWLRAYLAHVHALLGNNVEAFHLLEQSGIGSNHLRRLSFDSDFDGLRSDPELGPQFTAWLGQRSAEADNG